MNNIHKVSVFYRVLGPICRLPTPIRIQVPHVKNPGSSEIREAKIGEVARVLLLWSRSEPLKCSCVHKSPGALVKMQTLT